MSNGKTVLIFWFQKKDPQLGIHTKSVQNLHNSLYVFSEDIPGVCRILHNSLNVISENILEVCRILHTFIFHSRQGCIIFHSKIKLIIFKIKFQTTYTTISNTHYFPCQTGHFQPRVINSGIWLFLTYPNFWLRSLSINSLISDFFFFRQVPPSWTVVPT